ncbi:MAG TPA: hypothetical protein VIF15_17010 [Polyangiaceae bacterium]
MGQGPRFALFGALAVAAGVACSNTSADQVTAPVALGMTSNIAAYYQDQNTTMYEVQVAVPLPVKKPSDSQVQSLGPPPAGTPYAHAPYLKNADESVEGHFTISNLDDQQHVVWMLIDPWNEFVRWSPGVTVVNDEQTTPNYGYDLVFVVPGKSRVEGTLTTDDMHEIAIKLASAQNVLASPQAQPQPPGMGNMNAFNSTGIVNNIFNPQNRSNANDPIYTPWIPPVIAGLTGFDLGLRTYEAANVAVEVTLDVQDLNGDRFVKADSTDPQLGPPPVTLSPVGARF